MLHQTLDSVRQMITDAKRCDALQSAREETVKAESAYSIALQQLALHNDTEAIAFTDLARSRAEAALTKARVSQKTARNQAA